MSRKLTKSASTHAEKAVPDTLSLTLIRSELTNAQDEDVLNELEGAQFGKLAVDRFAPLIRASGESDEVAVGRLRHEIAKIYFRAARKRAQKRASTEQLRRADQALQSFEKGIKHLEAASPEPYFALWPFRLQTHDPKGESEVTEFSVVCSSYRSRAVGVVIDLKDAIKAERRKTVGKGERKKRLRILVEELALWWIATTEKPVYPTVKSKRRDGAPSVVIGRAGEFLEFAKDILFELDSFNPSEVELAVGNVSRRLEPQSS